MGNLRRYKPFIIMESGRQRYSSGKMQSAGIFMEILENDDVLEERIQNLPPIRNKQVDASFYLIGSEKFTGRAREIICGSGFKGTVSREFSNEDMCMKALGYQFPKNALTMVKEPVTRTSALKDELDKMGSVSDLDIIAAIVAADELKDYRISPPTPENIRKALVARTQLYIQDADRAEDVVDKYLTLAAKNSR